MTLLMMSRLEIVVLLDAEQPESVNSWSDIGTPSDSGFALIYLPKCVSVNELNALGLRGGDRDGLDERGEICSETRFDQLLGGLIRFHVDVAANLEVHDRRHGPLIDLDFG